MRYKEIDINIKAIPDKEDEALLNQLMGAKGVTVSDTDSEETSDEPTDNPGKVASDDPNTVPSVFPPQQELEMKKQEAGKDLGQFSNIQQDADEKAPDEEARVDEPLVKQPETTKGDMPGVPAEMKSKQPKNESEFIQRLKTLSGQD
jgi:hypothetical protein|tara:strand:- start:1891 stop:2331 length:441 start_codon:yes stop_codon:yes gene_type:complete